MSYGSISSSANGTWAIGKVYIDHKEMGLLRGLLTDHFRGSGALCNVATPQVRNCSASEARRGSATWPCRVLATWKLRMHIRNIDRDEEDRIWALRSQWMRLSDACSHRILRSTQVRYAGASLRFEVQMQSKWRIPETAPEGVDGETIVRLVYAATD